MGLSDGPPRQEKLRARLMRSHDRHGAGWLHRLLSRLDPEAANRIHPNDVPKLTRALEVCLASRKPISEAFAEGRDALAGFRLLRIGLNPPRAQLYDRLNQRAAAMFTAGLVEETRVLLERFGPVAPLRSLGYLQAAAILRGDIAPDEAIKAAQQGHRNYAKRQMTWFRREPEVQWIEYFGDSATAISDASELVAAAGEVPLFAPLEEGRD
jgi:tRNA dimethylallyltransferase